MSKVLLEGPAWLTSMYSEKDKRTIIILGEVHFILERVEPQELCKRDGKTPVLFILDYFDFLFSSFPDKKFDVFAELYTPMHWASAATVRRALPEITRSVLEAFVIRYSSCIQQKRQCLFPNVRFHYTDLRADVYMSPILKEFAYNKINSLQAYLLMQLNDFTPDYLKNHILTFPVMQKELQKTRNDAYVTILQDIDQRTQKVKTSTDNRQWMQSMMELWMGFMDYYLLARLFKPETSNNVIVYVGASHGVPIINMLSKLGYVETLSIHEEQFDYCLPITPQPGNFFFAPLTEQLSTTELINNLIRPSFTFETSWYSPSFSIQRLMMIYFSRAGNIYSAYERMQRRENGTYFTFQKIRETLVLFVHNDNVPSVTPLPAATVMTEMRKSIKLDDKSVRVIYIYKNLLARLAPKADIQLRLLMSHTMDSPVADLLALLELQ